MAIKVKYTPTKFAALFGYSTKFEAQTLEDWGCSVEVTKSAWSVVSPEGKTIVGNIPLKEGVVELAKKGELQQAAKQVVATLIEKTYKHGVNWEHWTKTPPKSLDEVFTDAPKQNAPKKIADLIDESVIEALTEEASDLDVSKVVPLLDAKAVYQPVKGTSSSSRYFAVGFTKQGISFAARYDDQTLSIRAEGDVGKFKTELVSAGFNEGYIDSKGTYTSVHFHGLPVLMAQRTLAAVLAGTGFDFNNAFPKAEVFKDKGA